MEQALAALLECPLCLSTLTQPVCTPCGHTFCSACLSRSLTTSSTQSVCPICRSPCYAQPGYERAKRQPVVVLEKIVQLLAARPSPAPTPAPAEFNLGLFVCDEADFTPVPNRAIKIRAFEPQVVLLMNRCAQHGARFGLQSTLGSARGLLVRVDAIQPLRHSSELMVDCFVEGVYQVVIPPAREPASELYTCVARELDLAGTTGDTKDLVERCVALFTAKLAVGGQELAAQVFQDPYLRNVVHTLPGDAVALSYFLLDVLDVDMGVRFEPDVNARLEYVLGAMGDAGTRFKCERRSGQAAVLGSFSATDLSRNALFVAGWLVLVGVALGGFDSLMAFTQKLDPAALKFFQNVTSKPFNQQAVSFLNAYWPEIGGQAEFIFSCAYETIKYADMHAKGVMYIHLYDEGTDLDFNIGLYFYEQLVKRVLEAPEGAKWRNDKQWKPSMPEMQTAIVRKQELREKVDVDFDGRISFLEYLLYQYREFCNPADFVERSMRANVADDEAMIAAKAALEDVNAAIRAYQTEKIRLEELAAGTGVKALGAKNQLAQLNSSPLLERLQVALIKAEAAIRLATKAALARQESGAPSNQAGNMFWMNRELEQNKALYGRKN